MASPGRPRPRPAPSHVGRGGSGPLVLGRGGGLADCFPAALLVCWETLAQALLTLPGPPHYSCKVRKRREGERRPAGQVGLAELENTRTNLLPISLPPRELLFQLMEEQGGWKTHPQRSLPGARGEG